ncbi:surface antigen BspA-like [Trichomonas vaginalis G3]|uniref:Surface antigen BspA-like n=1 Tax=Trichomonas vaginalis (strain ATCC PRA-98 / G3) TaxID=412133 RepID=A2DVB6_TRIV3|nr:antigen BSP-related family [Trichomonas vaginalis G3]EAY15595.1 surface antigen BspA-like [Trichomonas vaginalis G3]KAI5530203.1 antigen BSP-related family [Trichomonas vaginalis G3]|eukprot:XP_001327818.1 surface antigen BspA-like [Trichomonas vaginalis G3]
MFFVLSSLIRSAPTYTVDGKTLTINGDGIIEQSDVQKNIPADCEKVIIQGDISEIGNYAFNSSNSLVTVEITAPIIRIGNGSFFHCNKLVNFTNPPTCQYVGDQAFRFCYSLVTFTSTKTTYYYGKYCFDSDEALQRFDVFEHPDAKDPTETVRIGYNCFNGCKHLIELFLPPTLTEIGDRAFYNCEGIVNASIPLTIKKIGEFAFFNCKGLIYLEFPAVAEMGKDAFASCERLTNISFGASLTVLEQYVFSDCPNLQYVDGIKNVNQIKEGVFKDCDALTDFIVPDGVSVISGKSFTKSAITTITFPPSIKMISANAFSSCGKLQTIKFSGDNNIENIADFAFKDCVNLTSFDFGSKLTKIGKLAFTNTALKSVTIAASVTSIDSTAFSDISTISEIKVDASNQYYVNGACGAVYSKDKTSLCWFIPTYTGEFKYEQELTTIKQYAFSGATISEVSIPESVTTIEKDAFASSLIQTIKVPGKFKEIPEYFAIKSENLVNLVLNEGITTIGNSSFADCTKLVEVKLPNSLEKLSHYSFRGCTSLKEINLENVSRLGLSVFGGCTSLERVSIPSAIRRLSNYLFSGCTSLYEVTLNDMITSIGAGCFQQCTALKSITLPKSLKRINKQAFTQSSIQNLIIPENVSRIVGEAFLNMPELETIVFNGVINSIEEFPFAYCPKLHAITFFNNIQNVSDYFLGDDVEALRDFRYCGTQEVKGDFLNKYAGTQGFVASVGDYYKHGTIGGITAHVTTLCHAPYVPTPAPTQEPTATPKPDNHKKNLILILSLVIIGTIILTALIVTFVVRCVMKKTGWKKNETLTESLLTQTV